MAGLEVCPHCGQDNTLERIFYECPKYTRHIPGNVLRKKRKYGAPCLWLRGLVPSHYTHYPCEPARQEIRATGCCMSPGFEAAGLVVGTDGCGGPYTKDARARHVGWAVTFGKLTDNGLEVVGTMSGVLPLMVSSGTLDVTSDCRPAIKYTKQRAFTEKVPLRWSPGWHQRHRLQVTWVRSHQEVAKFAEEFGVHNLWRRDLNSLADSLAGERAIEAQNGARYRCILEVDRLAFDINHHLACVTKQVLQHADKAHFAKSANAPKAPVAPGPNKKSRLLAKVSSDLLGHKWEVTSKAGSNNMTIK